jgi:hypothetical protein
LRKSIILVGHVSFTVEGIEEVLSSSATLEVASLPTSLLIARDQGLNKRLQRKYPLVKLMMDLDSAG